MLEALAELVEWRALDRDRQRDRRLDRERTASRRGIGEPGAAGPTVRELDRMRSQTREQIATASVAKLVAAGLIVPERAASAAAVVRGRLDAYSATRAWCAAFEIVRFRPCDWEPGRFSLTPAAMSRLVSLATRAAVAMRASDGHPAKSVDGWWLAAWRPALADHEIGMVLSAADDLDGGRTTEHAIGIEWRDEPSGLVALIDHPDLASMLDSALEEFEEEDGRDFARVAALRWQRLRDAGWDEDEISRKRPPARADS